MDSSQNRTRSHSNRTKGSTDARIKFAHALTTLIDNSPFKHNRKPVWEALGVTSAAVSQYLQGQARPRWETLIDLAEFFDVSLDYLILGTESSRPVVGENRSIARYVDMTLANIQSRNDAKTWLMARIGDALVERVEEAADVAVSRVSALTGVVTDEDTMVLESFSRETCLLLTYLDYNVIDVEPNTAVAGRFAGIVAANLRSRPARPYSFLLATNGDDDFEDKVDRFKQLLTDEFHVSKAKLRQCRFRATSSPVMAGCGLYKLDIDGLKRHSPSLFHVLESYLDDSQWMGYLTHPNGETRGDMLFDRRHLRTAREMWGSLWEAAQVID